MKDALNHEKAHGEFEDELAKRLRISSSMKREKKRKSSVKSKQK